MSRTRAFFLMLLVWAAVYLPGLAAGELKGEEARRILPAVTMIETGDWLVPHLGGRPYLRKPPLMNWLIAVSFKATGSRSVWAARLPSALAVLGLGALLIALADGRAGWLTPRGGLAAAVMSMTTFGLLAKARFAGAEIEGVYAPLSAAAMVLWLAAWVKERPPWLLWTLPFIPLGLATLAKGPGFHLVFFYVLVAAVLWRGKAMRSLTHPAHFAGIALAAAIFLAWYVPYMRTPEAAEAAKVWRDQGIGRFTDAEISAGGYLLNLPRGLADLLPWVLFAPFVVRLWKITPQDRASDALKTGTLALAAAYVVVLLVPGSLPRYVLPAGVMLCAMLAVAMAQTNFLLSERCLKAFQLTALAVVFLLLAATGLVGFLDFDRPLHLLAQKITRAVPDNQSLTICDADDDAASLGAFFHLRTPVRWAGTVAEIPRDAEWVLAHEKKRTKLPNARPEYKLTAEFPAKDGRKWLLFHRE